MQDKPFHRFAAWCISLFLCLAAGTNPLSTALADGNGARSADEETPPAVHRVEAPADDRPSAPPCRVLAAGWYELFLVDVQAGTVEAVIDLDETAQDIAVTADGRTAYVGTDAGLFVVDLTTRQIKGRKDWGVLDSVELLDGGRLLAAMVCPGETPFKPARPHTILLVDIATDRTLRTLLFSPRAFDLFASCDGSCLFASTKVGRTISWTPVEPLSEAEFRHLPLTDGGKDLQRMTRLATLAPLPGSGGQQRLIGVETPGDDRPIILWIVRWPEGDAGGDPLVRRVTTKRTGAVQGAAVQADGKRLFINCRDHLMVYDLEQMAEAAWVPLPNIHRWLALAEGEKRVVLTCTPEQGVGYLTVVQQQGDEWSVANRIDLPGSVNVIAAVPGPR